MRRVQMGRRGCGISVIIEGLEVTRQGLITESAEEQVQKDIKKFLKDRDVSSRDKKRFYNILTDIYSLCNDAGPYKLIKGEFESVKGTVDDYENPEAPEIYPSLYTYKYKVRFLAAIEIKEFYRTIYATLKADKPNYDTIDMDSFAIIVSFHNGDSGLYIAIEREARGIKVEIGYESLVIEGKTGAFGTEIGLPIDQENCESTGIGGISTPTGGFSDVDTEKKKKKLIPVAEDETEEDKDKKEPKDEEEESSSADDDVERYRCPRCGSANVNSDGEKMACSDCTFDWTITEREPEVDRMLPQDDDITNAEYCRMYPELTRQQDNQIECIVPEQQVMKGIDG